MQKVAPENKSRAHSDSVKQNKQDDEVNQSSGMNLEDQATILRDAISLPDLGVSVSGIAGRFPKSDNVNEFERNLRQGVDMINDEDNSRFTCRLWNLPPRAGRIKDLSRFDADFFGYTKDEANYVDYQMRLLYEVVYESILDAGLNPASLRGSKTGVFFGFHCNEFENAMVDDPGFKSNGYYGQFATKIAQYFDLRGLTVTFDAACASGFVGLHHGVQAIASGECERAIVCSSNIPIHPTGSFIFLQMQMLSPTGYSRFMDSRADGYVKSESCVSVVLQRKQASLRNYASFLATMTSVDGFKREGITFPSDKSQERLIRQTKELAGISTNHVEYFEAHGTGTPAGDPQEAKAISNVYTPHSDQPEVISERTIGPLLLGSVKTNMGHSEAASGLCALTKVALMLEHELIYPSLHFAEPNANITSLKDGRVQFVAEQRPLRAKVVPLSCYGFGGSNVHAIVKANELGACSESLSDPMRCTGIGSTPDGAVPRLVLMFGRGEQQLNNFFDKMLDTQDYQTKNCLSDDFLRLLDSLNADKIDRLMSHRGYMIIDLSTKTELTRSVVKCELSVAQQISQLVDAPSTKTNNHFQEAQECLVNLVFPGLGCTYDQMGAGLTNFAPFWSNIEKLQTHLDTAQFEQGQIPNLRILLSGVRPSTSFSLAEKFASIVGYQMALVNLLANQTTGINISSKIKSIVGHSLGEVAAAYADNLLEEREAIQVAYCLGNTLDNNRHLIAGRMIALETSQSDAERLIESFSRESSLSHQSTLAVCCINGPQSVTLSGSPVEMDSLCEWLNERAIYFVVVEDCVALHNPRIMDAGIERKLCDDLQKILTNNTDITSTRWIPATLEAGETKAEYFASCMCEKVDFARAMQTMELKQNEVCLELGPSCLFEAQFKMMSRNKYVKCMRKDTKPELQLISLLKCLGELYQAGLNQMSLVNLYPSLKSIDCVRRQTPSLSSLFEWQHDEQYFVPRYPLQFSKSSAKCEMPVDVMQDRDKYLLGHCVEGRCLFPATGYLFLIWRVFSFTKRKIYDACFHDVEQELVPIEFHQVRLLRAVIISNRAAQLYIHLEESTGRFEIKEGGSVVVEGWAKSPGENPTGLLYEEVRQRITQEQLPVDLVQDDIYKQFRVSGYDYGDTFQNIVEASGDGRYCRVKFNGHFVALTDSILQSIFLAVTQYAPSGGLFLPTRFDYVRFQPEIIKAKLRLVGMKLDRSDGSLNTMAKREIMTKIMERDGALVDLNNQKPTSEEPTTTDNDQEANGCEQPECFFDTYCDPVTGIIITDGIEMRGIKASPAPRKMDTKDVLLESYQFVPDCEEPIQDEPLTGFSSGFCAQYKQTCNYIALKLAAKLMNLDKQTIRHHLDAFNEASENEQSEQQAIEFKEKNLECLYSKLSKSQNLADKASGEMLDDDQDYSTRADYDIKRNRNLMFLSILEQLEHYAEAGKLEPARINQIMQRNRLHLMNDLLAQGSFTCERLMRPLMELVMENSCQRKSKLSVLEINEDDGLMRTPINQLIKSIEPTYTLEYLLAHPEPSRVSNLAPANEVKTHQLKNIQSLLADQRLRDLDLILYKDISCYNNLPQQQQQCVADLQSPEILISSLSEGVKRGGFLLVLMRSKLTLTENLLLSMIQSQTSDQLISRIIAINENLAHRTQQLRTAAKDHNLIEVSSKCDLNGCLALLFRKPDDAPSKQVMTKRDQPAKMQHVLLRVTHQDEQNIDAWLSKLKENFKTEDEPEPVDEPVEAAELQMDPMNEVLPAEETPENNKIIWLCAVDTRQESVSGLVGMMQALRKELGATRLRCFYDQYTFVNCDHNDISSELIEASQLFKQAFKRDLVWNCVNRHGQLGSYRHFTINQYLNYANCLCDSQKQQNSGNTLQSEVAKPCYVTNAARGDLSSFTWFEAPYKYLEEKRADTLVQVCYSALNFRDIMLATGRLPLDALPLKLAMSDCHMGLEFSGYDTKSGRRVMGMVPARGIATQIVCPRESTITIDIPDELDMREAATIPVVYATVVLALIYRGKIQPGESILIHAGSGGVGQAAIRVALHFKLDVYTTVGSDEKRQFLLEEFGKDNGNYLRADRIFSSRDTKFERQIMRLTSGRGVDLVLNSLADDKLQASVRCLADGGRFLEIGKYDMSTDARLELIGLNHNKTFHGILLDKLFDSDDTNSVFRRQLERVMETIKQGFKEGFVKPIKYTLFKRHQIEEAFRFMASGKHIGKILIEINAQHSSKPLPLLNCVPRFQMNPQASHIVTGGLGGFGLELIKWLVQQGARRIVVTSRSGLRNGYQRTTLKRLEAQGAKFNIVTYDTTSRQGVAKLLKEATDMSISGQLGSIFHLAMVLKDQLLENLTSDEFQQVCKPKITTGELMDELLVEGSTQVDHFVMFSSVTSGKGNAGQCNYAYANSLLERICERRRARGEHGLAIQWGAIGDVGAAYENLGGNNVVVGGTIPQRMPSCYATLGKLLCSPFATCLSVVPVDRGSDVSALGAKGDLVSAIFHVLGIKDPSKVSDEATLGELGLDSLMAVEIRQYIEREYDMTLNMQQIRALTIGKIREIGEKGPAGAKKINLQKSDGANNAQQQQAISDQQQPRLVAASYGTKIPAATKPTPQLVNQSTLSRELHLDQLQSAQLAVDNPLTINTLQSNLLMKLQNGHQIEFDANFIGGFKPELCLPRRKFKRLNSAHLSGHRNSYHHINNYQEEGADSPINHQRPLFFLPPIYGSFELLEPICKLINRPCVGLNWSRSHARAANMSEAVQMYIATLEQWKQWGSDGEECHQVDLVGYSYGATVAFEIMVRLHGHQGSLKPGRLILLDGSPKQIEMGSQLMSALNRKARLSDTDKVDELLMAYVLAHGKHLAISRRHEFMELQDKLQATKKLEDKLRWASETLCNLLELTTTTRVQQPTSAPSSPTNSEELAPSPDQTDSGAASDTSTLSDGELSEESAEASQLSKGGDDLRSEMELAMEAFMRRYDIIDKYKCVSKLPKTILVRAEEVYLKTKNVTSPNSKRDQDDLGLSSVVNEVELHVMAGNHHSFLDKNLNKIAKIINNSVQ